MDPEFSTLPEATGLAVFDPIENAHIECYTDQPVDPTPASADRFFFPVTTAVEVTVSELAFHHPVAVTVKRGPETVATAAGNTDVEVPPGSYELEVANLPMKLYIGVENGVSIRQGGGNTVVSLPEPAPIVVGVRSLHTRPAETVTTTGDPRDLMRAVSTFGTALKTTSPERSFPSLRGHPPQLERGDALSIPDGLDTPETGVRIEVPERLGAVVQVSTLAYYLGAEVVPGDRPRLVTGSRRVRLDETADAPLLAGDDLQSVTNGLLKRLLTLDCVVRTAGYYPVPLAERDAVAREVDLDRERLYDLPLAERTANYLDVPAGAVDPAVPRWRLTTDVDPSPDAIPHLPFTAERLSLLRTDVSPEPAPPEEPSALDDFFRGEQTEPEPETEPSTQAGEVAIRLPETSSVGHAWVGEGFPLDGSKPSAAAYRNRLDAEPREGPGIDILVVCNDPRMDEETREQLYGLRDVLQFDITRRDEVSTAQLRELLSDPVDLFHFVGHVDERGLSCSDGWLDLRTLDRTGVDAFLLNACRSYAQGEALVEAGATGGVATTADVPNVVASEVGRTLARLLNHGFSLHSALDVAHEAVLTSYRYTIVGDGELTLCQSRSGSPELLDVSRREDGYSVTHRSYPQGQYGVGSFAQSLLEPANQYYLVGGPYDTFDVDENGLQEALSRGPTPVRLDGELRWSDELLGADL